MRMRPLIYQDSGSPYLCHSKPGTAEPQIRSIIEMDVPTICMIW